MFGKNKIELDKELMEKVKKMSSIAGYSSADEFVTHMLEKEIAKIEGDGPPLTEEEIKKRLQGLGYIS